MSPLSGSVNDAEKPALRPAASGSSTSTSPTTGAVAVGDSSSAPEAIITPLSEMALTGVVSRSAGRFWIQVSTSCIPRAAVQTKPCSRLSLPRERPTTVP